MRIVRLTPAQARAVSEQLARVAVFVRQVLDAFTTLAQRAAEGLQAMTRLAEQLAPHRA